MARPLLPPALVAGLDPRLLARLLAPHRAFLEARRLALGDDTPAWRARLADVLNGNGPGLPAALQFALCAVGDLANPEGEGALRALAAERGRAVPVAPGRAADVAAWAFLDERALFRMTRARLRAPAAAPAVVYGAPLGVAPRSLSPAGEAALRRGLADDRGELGGGRVVLVADLREELVVLEFARPSTAPERARAPELAIVHKTTGALAAKTPDTEHRRRMRSLFGRVLFGDDWAFSTRLR